MEEEKQEELTPEEIELNEAFVLLHRLQYSRFNKNYKHDSEKLTKRKDF